MQRIAWGAGVSGMLSVCLFGCTTHERLSGPEPLPPAIMRTSHGGTARVAPAPAPRPRVTTDVTLAQRRGGIDPSVLRPGVAIKRGRWQSVVVHHSATKSATPAGMDRFHREVRGWEHGLGYHFVIGNGVNTPDGRIYIGARWARQLHGAHCKNTAGVYFGRKRSENYYNNHGIGICLIGNFDEAPPTPAQLRSLEALVETLCEMLELNPARVYGHGEITHRTACPGSKLQWKLPQVRANVADALAVRLEREMPLGLELGFYVAWTGPVACDDDASAMDLRGALESGEPVDWRIGERGEHVAYLEPRPRRRGLLRDGDHDDAAHV